MSLLSVTELAVVINGTTIVDRVTLSVDVGEWLCVIGPNGAGKSTLLRAIAGVVPYTGRVTARGRDLASLSHRDRACWIAYVAQEPLMPAGMRVMDYVLLGRTAHIRLLTGESRRDLDFAAMVLEELGLTAFAARDVASLSGGERQRVALARALAQASPIVLLDEPTTALDMGYQQEVLEVVDRLRRDGRIGVLMTMHDLTVAGMYPDSLLLMSAGTAVTHGHARDVLTPQRISATYGATVKVIDDGNGPIVVPQRG